MKVLRWISAMLWFLFFLPAAGPFALEDDYIELTRIDVSDNSESVSIKLVSDKPLRTIAYDVKKPLQIIFDILDDAKTSLPKELAVGKGAVTRVRMVEDLGKKMEKDASSYPVDFLVIELKSAVPYSSTKEGNASILAVSKHKEAQEIAHTIEPSISSEPSSPLKVSVKEEMAPRGIGGRRDYDEDEEYEKEENRWYSSFRGPGAKPRSKEEVTIAKLMGRQEALKQEIDSIQKKKKDLEKQIKEREEHPELFEEEKTFWDVTKKEAGKIIENVWIDLGNEDDITDNIRRLVGRERRKPNIWARSLRDKGYMFQEKGELDKAAELYKQAVKLDSRYAGVHNDLGVVYENMGMDDKAIDEYTAALVIDPHYLKAHTNLALLYERRGETGKARFHWKKRAYLGVPSDPWTQRARDKVRKKKRI